MENKTNNPLPGNNVPPGTPFNPQGVPPQGVPPMGIPPQGMPPQGVPAYIPSHRVPPMGAPGAVPPRQPSKAKKWTDKILIILGALLVFQIPLYMIRDLTVDRRSHAAEVEKEIGTSWGGKQEIQLIHQADREDVAAEITPEIRYRGIYETTVYTAKVKIKADYVDVPEKTTTGVKVSDLKAVTGASAMVNGKEVQINDQLKFDIPKGKSNCEITLTLRGSSNLQLKPNAPTAT